MRNKSEQRQLQPKWRNIASYLRPVIHVLFLPWMLLGCGGGGSNSAPPINPPPADSLTNIVGTAAAILSPGNANGQDEDPTLLRTNNALALAWFSDRNGTQNDGVIDREIFFMSTGDGRRFSMPTQITRADRYSFYPRLASDAQNRMHLAWWRVIPTPEGCIPDDNCNGGTLNRVLYKRANSDGSWNIDEEQTAAAGPGDWLPSVVVDRRNSNVLVYFASPVRNEQGANDLSLSTLRIFRVVFDGTTWTQPVHVANVNANTSHNTYPTVVQRNDNSFMMVWTRYDLGNRNFDPIRVISEPSAETWFGESTDGLSFTNLRQLSESAASAAPDVFPSLYVAHDGTTWFALWQSGSAGTAVETAVTGANSFTRVTRSEIGGNTPLVVATPTSGVFWSVWTVGALGREKLEYRYFLK